MKIKVMVELDIQFETDGEKLDYNELSLLTADVLRTHVENAMDDVNELEKLVDDISEVTGFLVSEVSYEVN